MIDVALLLVRVVVGALLAGHGLQKLTGWFGGPGVSGNAGFLETLGYRQPRRLAWVHGAAETGAGVLLVLGALTPLAAAAVVAVMLNAAVVVHARNGLWVHNGGMEYPIVLATVAMGLALTGPGRFAIDALTGATFTGAWALAALVLGLVTGGVVLATRKSGTVGRRAPSTGQGRPAAA